MKDYLLYYGDIHFHTNYSDNKERATVKEMVRKALELGLTIIGTGDHNHNLTKGKWDNLLLESDEVRNDRKIMKQYPSLILMNNCEMTFHLGHFHVLLPEKISGTIGEAFDYLHNKTDKLLVVNHPVPGYDYWHERIIPHAKGIEVINGSLIRKIGNIKLPYENVLDIPMVNTYSKYLAMNLPVSAIGNSDAHSLNELGCGVSGYWMKASSGPGGVSEAILDLRTFAATDNKISMDWNFDQNTKIFSWDTSCEFIEGDEEFIITLHNRNKSVEELTSSGGKYLDESGLYWISIYNGKRMAISSPVKVGEWSKDPVPTDLDKLLNDSIIESGLEKLSLGPVDKECGNRMFTGNEVSIYCCDDNPVIKGADGKIVEYHLISEKNKILPGQMGLLNEHELSERQLEEFILWLNRNEVHEYRFVNLQLHEGEQMLLTGTLVHYCLLPESSESERWKSIAERMKTIDISRTKIFTRLNHFPHKTMSLPGQYKLPLTVYDREGAIISALYPHLISFSGGDREFFLVQRILSG